MKLEQERKVREMLAMRLADEQRARWDGNIFLVDKTGMRQERLLNFCFNWSLCLNSCCKVLEEMTLDMHGHFPVATLIAILTLQHRFNRISSHTCSICSARPTRDWFVTCCYVTCALSDKEYWDQIALCSLRRQNCDLCFVQEFRLQVNRAISVWLRIASGQTEPGRMASHKQLS